MAKMAQLSELSTILLTWFRALEASRAGFEVCGVPGWAPVKEVEILQIYGTARELRALAERGLLSRLDVRVPDAPAPVWVYRITDAGARALAVRDGKEYVPIARPERRLEQRVYVRPGVDSALYALRHAAEHSGKREWIESEPEWRMSRELSDWLSRHNEETGRSGVFFSDDLMWCVKVGLAQRREDPVVLYRITITGAAVRPLVWR